jgi:hypothetical protein
MTLTPGNGIAAVEKLKLAPGSEYSLFRPMFFLTPLVVKNGGRTHDEKTASDVKFAPECQVDGQHLHPPVGGVDRRVLVSEALRRRPDEPLDPARKRPIRNEDPVRVEDSVAGNMSENL